MPSPTTPLPPPPRPRHRVTPRAPPPSASPKPPARLANKRHQALSQEWRAPTPSNIRTTTPETRTSNCDTHTCTATNTQTERHNTPNSGNTRNQRRRRWQHQQPCDTLANIQPTQETTQRPCYTQGVTNAPPTDGHPEPPPTASTPSETPTPPTIKPTQHPHHHLRYLRTDQNTGYNACITQANGIKHIITSITPPSASPPATSATRGNQNHHNR